jgi:5-deoxy-D-glucuronate isomerase
MFVGHNCQNNRKTELKIFQSSNFRENPYRKQHTQEKQGNILDRIYSPNKTVDQQISIKSSDNVLVI